ncbi:regulator of chromosome condensation 1/beta-lactamase-inhibitor protein II [Chaetomium sp. MPI-SDFR-AT-0129]|nr:regulator of chromosome condensation 1/beta-lactamase-inhibitor protein II [Chaetomium sp. MPI-SDFR-AT-0129]
MASLLLSRATALRGRPLPLRSLAASSSQWARYSTTSGPTRRSGPRIFSLLAVTAAAGAGAVFAYPYIANSPGLTGPPQIEKADIVYEKPRKKAASKEEGRAIVSPQHVQVKNSWEHPGVYAWGSNIGKVVAPDSNEPVIKTPRRIPFFDGQILRDLKLDRDFGVAITEKGDLVQWGTAFSKDSVAPTVTLQGKNLSKIAISRDRIIALSSNGSVYSLPVSQADQVAVAQATSGTQSSETSSSSWLPFWSSSSGSWSGCRSLTPSSLGWGEKVVDVKSGLQHCLLLTSKGRVFSAAASSEAFPSQGQLGVPGLTWETRPKGPFDQPHEVIGLKGSSISAIAAGALHSLVLDNKGRVFSFGDNANGQLGFETAIGAIVDTPSPLPIDKLYAGTGFAPNVTAVAAGGQNSYFTVDATKTQGHDSREVGRTVADTWACGAGIYGNLGSGKWTHVSPTPNKIKALSGLYEFDEAAGRVTPIRVAGFAVGSTHACAVLANYTHLTSSSQSSSSTDTSFGADALWWGGNEHYQLGNGKRSNVNAPVYIGPLDARTHVQDGQVGAGVGGADRLQLTPRTTVRLGEHGKGRKVSVEQRVECGRFVTAVYSGA